VTAQTIRVLIIDDGESMRRALRLRLEGLADMEVVAEASTISDAVRKLLEDCADVALLSGSGPGIDWGAAVRRIKQQCNEVKVIVLTSYQQDAIRALEAGASAHLLKETEVGALANSIRRVVAEHWPPASSQI
jgi:DNA-binding NarL/FixJ family response regulator